MFQLDIQYTLITTPPPPPTTPFDPNANANANANANSGTGTGSGNSNSALNELSNAAAGNGTTSTSLSPGAIAGIIGGGLALLAGIGALGFFAFSKCKKGSIGKGSKGYQNTRQFNVTP